MNDILEEFRDVEKKKTTATRWIVVSASVLLLSFLLLEFSFFSSFKWRINFSDPEIYIFGFINLLLTINIYLLIKGLKAGWVISVLINGTLFSFALFLLIENVIKPEFSTFYWRPILISFYSFSSASITLLLLYLKVVRDQFNISQSVFQTVTVIGSIILLIAFLFAS